MLKTGLITAMDKELQPLLARFSVTEKLEDPFGVIKAYEGNREILLSVRESARSLPLPQLSTLLTFSAWSLWSISVSRGRLRTISVPGNYAWQREFSITNSKQTTDPWADITICPTR